MTFWLNEMLDADTLAEVESQIGEAVARDGKLMALVGSLPMVKSAAIKAATSCLKVDLLGLLAEGWCTAKAIRAYRDPEKYPAGTTSVLKLAKHSLERDIKPAITVVLGGEQKFPLDLALTLSGAFQGVDLSISDGCIVSVGTGTCKVAFQVKVAGKAVTESKTLKELKLPGEYKFPKPLKIP